MSKVTTKERLLKKVSEDFQAIRKSKNITVAELARLMSTSWNGAGNLEKPTNNPTIGFLAKAAELLDHELVVSFHEKSKK